MFRVTVVSGKKLMVQTKDDVRFEEFGSWYSMGKRVAEFHEKGQISQQKFHHLNEIVNRHMNESVNIRR